MHDAAFLAEVGLPFEQNSPRPKCARGPVERLRRVPDLELGRDRAVCLLLVAGSEADEALDVLGEPEAKVGLRAMREGE